MPWSDVDQPPEVTRRKSGIAIRTSSMLEFFSINSSREVREVTVNMIVLVAMHRLPNGMHIVVYLVATLISLNE